jgi:hypothetical protein
MISRTTASSIALVLGFLAGCQGRAQVPPQSGGYEAKLTEAKYDREWLRLQFVVAPKVPGVKVAKLPSGLVLEVETLHACGSSDHVPYLMGAVAPGNVGAEKSGRDAPLALRAELKLFEPNPMGKTPGRPGPECIDVQFSIREAQGERRRLGELTVHATAHAK